MKLRSISRSQCGSTSSKRQAVRPIGYVDLDDDVRTLADIREGDVPLEPGIRVELGVDGDDWFFSRVAD